MWCWLACKLDVVSHEVTRGAELSEASLGEILQPDFSRLTAGTAVEQSFHGLPPNVK